MRNILLLAGAAALASASPVFAQGKSQGNNGKSHAAKSQGAKGKAMKSNRTSTSRLWGLNARGSCPPGLAKKNNGCLPPGQAKKAYNVGQRYNRNFGNVWSYDQIPVDWRNQYGFDPNHRYYYNQGYLYQVDPTTMVVRQVISALLR